MSIQWGHDIPKARFFSPHNYKLFTEFMCSNLEREDEISDNNRKKTGRKFDTSNFSTIKWKR